MNRDDVKGRVFSREGNFFMIHGLRIGGSYHFMVLTAPHSGGESTLVTLQPADGAESLDDAVRAASNWLIENDWPLRPKPE